MPAERRTDEEIRREIASEREQLAGAIADLRAATGGKQTLARIGGGVVATGIALAALRRRSRRRGARSSHG